MLSTRDSSVFSFILISGLLLICFWSWGYLYTSFVMFYGSVVIKFILKSNAGLSWRARRWVTKVCTSLDSCLQEFHFCCFKPKFAIICCFCGGHSTFWEASAGHYCLKRISVAHKPWCWPTSGCRCCMSPCKERVLMLFLKWWFQKCLKPIKQLFPVH